MDLNITYAGRNDMIELSDGKATLSVSFYRLQGLMETLGRIVPPPCPTCEGTGEVMEPPEDPVMYVDCPECEGARVTG
jgi:hypothetical protein